MLASTIAARWRRGEAPDLAALMAPVDRGDDDAWCEALLADAERRSERGLVPTLGHYLSIFPWLRPGSRTVQELLAVEVADMPADPAGLEPRLLDRYGQPFADDIRIVVELHALLRAVPSEGGTASPPDPQPGAVLGKYRLHRTLGRGAFGQVWLAWDDELECFVALKLIPRAGDSDRRTALLLAEARAASSLNHPNVVSVRAAGRFPTPGDWLYIEMQLCGDPAPTREEPKAVAVGQPLTEARSRLGNDWRSVARTMADITRGVVAAHAQGVVHCDLKPANVLVTPSGRAMVADFGLSASDFLPVVDASASPDQTHGMAMSLTLRTAAGKAIRGTPAYMSPEQARGESVKPISDVYGLGAVLFWLLSGNDPHQARGGETWRTLLDRVGDVTQPTPALPSGAHPTLERICRKAMRKRPEERYLSASAMLADLEALLDRRVPAGVGPDSAWQPLALWTRRNALPVSIAAVAIVGLTTLTGVAIWQRGEALAQRDLAEVAGKRAETAAAKERQHFDQLKVVSDFQVKMLGEIDTVRAGIELMAAVGERFSATLERAGVPEADRTARLNALRQELVHVNATDAAVAMIDRTILRPAIKAMDAQFKDDPVTDANLRQALADLYRGLGLYDAATPLQESALASRRRMLGEEHPDTLTSIGDTGRLLILRGKLSEAEPYVREALEKHRRVLGSEDPATLTALSHMGDLLGMQAKFAEAEAYHREALDRRRKVLGEEHAATIASISTLGSLLIFQVKTEQAEPLVYEALDKSRRVLGEEHPLTISALNNVGDMLYAQDRLSEIMLYYREVLEKRRRVLGDEHPHTIVSMNNLGSLLLELGELDEAALFLHEALRKSRRVRGPEHPGTLVYLTMVGDLLSAQGDLGAAERYYLEAVEKSRSVLGEEHSVTLLAISKMGALLVAQGKNHEAIDLLVRFEAVAREAFNGHNVWRLAGFLTTLGRARAFPAEDTGRLALAETHLLEAHRIYRTAKYRGPSHKDALACAQALVDLYTAWDKAVPGKGYDAKAAEWRAALAPP